jgi:hypothetical protein
MATRRRDRLTEIRLAAAAQCDPRSAARALREGPDAVRGLAGTRLREAMVTMGLIAAVSTTSAERPSP